MRRLRAEITVPELMISIASFAMALALLRVEAGRVALFMVIGPVIGATVQRVCGGRGILGGAIGGLVSYCGFAVAVYVWYYFYPGPGFSDYLDTSPSPFTLGVTGLVIGSIVGLFSWIVMPPAARPPIADNLNRKV